jgi:hypothetical protein
MAKTENIVISHETFWQALVVDTTSYALAIALIMPGYFLGIHALEWAGMFVFFIILMAKAATRTMTIDQARARLDEIEATRRID